MQYLVQFDIGQPADFTQQQLLEVWNEEAIAALGAKEAGLILGIWKVAGERTVFVLTDVPDNQTLDAIIEHLPLVQKVGSTVTVKPIPVYPYEDWAEQLKGFVNPA